VPARYTALAGGSTYTIIIIISVVNNFYYSHSLGGATSRSRDRKSTRWH